MDPRQIDRDGLRLKLLGGCVEFEKEWPAPELGVPSAVLLGLIARPEGLGIILTRRTEHLSNHPGQISLPGGRIEECDAGPADAALREAYEEIGLTSDRVELLGCLPPHTTITGFRVYPFVGWIEDLGELAIDRYEVAEVFEVPLGFVLDPRNHRRDSLVVDTVRHEFDVIPYAGHRIWGATAGILASLARLLDPAGEVRTHAQNRS
ncbi:MAG: CoA pyrophosphatase [Thermoleophilia bacterium]|nr:CoA pyrophosphatase [Thermoleophilia bacterium]